MKKSLLFLFALCILIFNTKAGIGGGVHVSSTHVSVESVHPSVSEHVTTTTHESSLGETSHTITTEEASNSHPIYETIHSEDISTEQIHPDFRSPVTRYYYLLHNTHTNRFDTVYGSSFDEVRNNVEKKTSDGDSKTSLATLGIVVAILCLVAFLAWASINYKDRMNRVDEDDDDDISDEDWENKPGLQ